MIFSQDRAGRKAGWKAMWHSPHSFLVMASFTGGYRSSEMAAVASPAATSAAAAATGVMIRVFMAFLLLSCLVRAVLTG